MADVETGGNRDGEVLLLALTASPASRREMLLTLDEFRRRALSETGCTVCDVLEDVSTTNRFVWMEGWLDRAQADLAVRRRRFRALLGAVRLLGAVESVEWFHREVGPDVPGVGAGCSKGGSPPPASGASDDRR